MSGRSVLLLLIARLRGRSGWKRWCRSWHHRRRVWFRRERHGPLLELCDHSYGVVEVDLCGDMSCPRCCIGGDRDGWTEMRKEGHFESRLKWVG